MVFASGESPLPQQVGPPTQYAREKRPIHFIICCVQAVLIITNCVFTLNITGAISTGMQVFVGYLAWQQDMNITYVSIYGIMCLLNAVFATVMAILPLVLEALTLNIFAMISALLLPVADLAGAYLAFRVYRDWDQAQKAAAAGPAGWLDSLGSTTSNAGPMAALGLGGMFGATAASAAPLSNASSMFSGKGYTLGDTDAFLTKARGYGEGGMASAGDYMGQAQAGAGGFFNQAQAESGGLFNQAQAGAGGYFNQAQDGASGFFNSAQDSIFGTKPGSYGIPGIPSSYSIPKGHHNVMSDPFMSS